MYEKTMDVWVVYNPNEKPIDESVLDELTNLYTAPIDMFHTEEEACHIAQDYEKVIKINLTAKY